MILSLCHFLRVYTRNCRLGNLYTNFTNISIESLMRLGGGSRLITLSKVKKIRVIFRTLENTSAFYNVRL